MKGIVGIKTKPAGRRQGFVGRGWQDLERQVGEYFGCLASNTSKKHGRQPGLTLSAPGAGASAYVNEAGSVTLQERKQTPAAHHSRHTVGAGSKIGGVQVQGVAAKHEAHGPAVWRLRVEADVVDFIARATREIRDDGIALKAFQSFYAPISREFQLGGTASESAPV
ncbi:hypothetical protein GCM10023185_43400 [Hymenobacter saemangeumensis]|uniref:Uncharacterized protein n=1 Tax=Hymenobacter saemangeumensis TaxID=1084522 RepID=A0ABP8ISD9_9BACT